MCIYLHSAGGVLHYIALQQALMWFLHIVAVYWTVKFPLHAKSFEAKGYTTYVHIAMLALIIILPFISIAVLFGTGGCRVSRFPNIICQARHPDVTFYALVLPVSILTAAGISMIILLFWVLYDVNKDMPYTPSTPSSNAIKVDEYTVLLCNMYTTAMWCKFTELYHDVCVYVFERHHHKVFQP